MTLKEEAQATRNRLQELGDLYRAGPLQFAPGDLVEWYPGLNSTTVAGPFVVLGYLPEPVILRADNPAGICSGELLDIRCGHLDQDGDLLSVQINSRRLRPLPDLEA